MINDQNKTRIPCFRLMDEANFSIILQMTKRKKNLQTK